MSVRVWSACGEVLFVLTFLQEVTRPSQRKTIVPSCWGPGATRPSCRFSEGQRRAAPKTCSACAPTGSPSTGTSTTTRWAEENPRSARSQCSWRCCPVRCCRCAGAGAPCPLCSRLTVQSQDELNHQPLQCVLAFSRFQLEGFPYSFLFKTFKVFQEPLKWKRSSTFCPLCCRCVDVYFSFPQTSVFTPAYGSITNVRVSSSMTTGQVLNLLLHKFRVNRRAH